jgi:hypothetical protein
MSDEGKTEVRWVIGNAGCLWVVLAVFVALLGCRNFWAIETAFRAWLGAQ